MASFAVTRELYDQACAHLRGPVEQVGFFLADFDSGSRRFVLREWRSIPPDGFEYQGAHHVTLTDETKTEIIRWAWGKRASLVEAHSHLGLDPAEFSPSDLRGFREWVPHLFWRLRRSPYAALVTADQTFDALAWVETAERPEQVDRLELDDGTVLTPTKRTLSELPCDGDSEVT